MPINVSPNAPKRGDPRKLRKLEHHEPGESAYGRAMYKKRQEASRKKRKHNGAQSVARKARLASEPAPKTEAERKERMKSAKPLYCGAKTKQGKKCRMAAGLGTNHLGIGACKFHGGNTAAHIVSAAKKKAQANAILLGAPKEINPLDAIIWCIQIKAGEVQWLSEKIADIEQKDWIEESMVGKRFHLFVRQRDDATKSLVDFSKTAITLGLAERAVKLAEQYGEMLAQLIKGILGDLNLDANQRAAAPAIIRRHLILVQGGTSAGELPPGTEELAQ